MSCGPLRHRRHGRCYVHRPLPRGLLLPGGVGVRCSVRVGLLLSGGLRRENKRHGRVVRYRRRGRVHTEWAGRVPGSIRRRRNHATLRDIDRRKVSGQHRGVERAGGRLMGSRKTGMGEYRACQNKNNTEQHQVEKGFKSKATRGLTVAPVSQHGGN